LRLKWLDCNISKTCFKILAPEIFIEILCHRFSSSHSEAFR
jgi:hypothetical protein